MNYEPRRYWEDLLGEKFDLRGTGEPGLSLAYNRACYTLRAEVLTRALTESGVALDQSSVLDVGCGTGFFVRYYLDRGARVTGIDLTSTSVERLRIRHPEAEFHVADVSDGVPGGPYEVVNAFDVLYHITDERRWESAVEHLARAVKPGGVLLLTDRFAVFERMAAHNQARVLDRYRAILEPAGLDISALYDTHVLLNRDLGAFRFLNRFPELLLAVDRWRLRRPRRPDSSANTLMLARRRS